MKKLSGIICGLVILCISGVAFAGQKTGFYLGGSAGYSLIDVSKDSLDFDDDDLGWKLFAGYNVGIIPLINLGVEGSYVDFGNAASAEVQNQDIDIAVWDLFGVVGLNLGPIGLFGKVGQAWWSSDSDASPSTLDDSSNDMVYGGGLHFQLGPVGIRAEYEFFDLDVANVHYISAGASWTF